MSSGGAATALGLQPNEAAYNHMLAVLLVETGDVEACRQQCRQELARFRDTKNPYIAQGMVIDCLALPGSGTDLAAVSAWADTAVTDTSGVDLPSFQLAKGLAEFRNGRFAEATEWMHKALNHSNSRDERDLAASAVLAMAQQALDQLQEAHAALARASEIEARLPKSESGDLGANWDGWILGHALLREAQVLIDSRQSLGGQPPPLSSRY